MSKQANTTMIGFFVIGGIVLAVLAILFFGSRDYFSPKENFVLFFKGSVNGLSVGAPVKFKGVNVGNVKSITLHVDQRTLDYTIPVVIQFDTNKVEYAYAEDKKETASAERLHALVRKGLRAQLDISSMITKERYVELDFKPKTPIDLEKNTTGYFQIPTIPSSTQMIEDALTSARNAMNSIDQFFSSPALNESVKSLNKTLTNVGNTVTPVGQKVNATLEELKAASRSMKQLLDYLSRHPEAIVTGKGNR